MQLDWKKLRYRAEWLFVSILAAIVPCVPRRVCHFFANLWGALASYLYRPGREVALENLESALGAELTAERRHQLVRESYQHFARAMSDLFWSPRLTTRNLSKLIDTTDLEDFKRSGTADRGAIFACLHYGGFEWIALALGLSDVRCTVVTQGFKNPLLTPIFN